MKRTMQLLAALMMATLLAAQVHAGPPPPPAPVQTMELYGVGWYGAIHMGANIWQDRGDIRFFDDGLGNSLTIDPTNDTGFYGGIKFGYVFGTGGFRFALEEDMFYNGWQTGADSTLVLNGVTTRSSSSIDINSGAFMTNGILRFGSGRFQPYIGAGIGFYYAESAGGNIGPFDTGGGGNHTDFAWNVLAGADWYFNPKMSMFIEYKFLEYVAQNDFGDDRTLGQQLLGAGLRFHF
jgi:opacity protein-like surface antigen